MTKLSDYASVGDSVSLACLAEKPFTITKIERSDYDGKKGLKITTKEEFKGKDLSLSEKARMNMTDADIEEFRKGTFSKFHTTRLAIVNQLTKQELQANLEKEPLGPLKCNYIKNPKKGGNPYWELVDA